jgi:hypothetical protein
MKHNRTCVTLQETLNEIKLIGEEKLTKETMLTGHRFPLSLKEAPKALDCTTALRISK